MRRSAWPTASSPRSCRCGQWRRSWRWAGNRRPRPAAPPPGSPWPPHSTIWRDRLSDAFDTRVKVEQGRRKGKIVVEFASREDLERIISAISPEWAQDLSA